MLVFDVMVLVLVLVLVLVVDVECCFNNRKKHTRHVLMYLSAPPINSTCVSLPNRDVKAADLWQIIQTALNLVTCSANGIKSMTDPKGLR